jgi:hypothetical protein
MDTVENADEEAIFSLLAFIAKMYIVWLLIYSKPILEQAKVGRCNCSHCDCSFNVNSWKYDLDDDGACGICGSSRW